MTVHNSGNRIVVTFNHRGRNGDDSHAQNLKLENNMYESTVYIIFIPLNIQTEMPHNDAKLTKPTIIGYLEESKTPCIAFTLLFGFLARHGQQLGIRTPAKRFRSDLRHELEIRPDQAFSVALEEIEGNSYSLDGNDTSET